MPANALSLQHALGIAVVEGLARQAGVAHVPPRGRRQSDDLGRELPVDDRRREGAAGLAHADQPALGLDLDDGARNMGERRAHERRGRVTGTRTALARTAVIFIDSPTSGA